MPAPTNSPAPSQKTVLFVLWGQLAFVVASFVMAGLRLTCNVGDVLYPAQLLLDLHMLWGVYSWYRLRGTLFDPYVIFFAAACGFNGGQSLLDVFNLSETGGVLDANFSPEIIYETVTGVFVGLTVMHFVALYMARRAALRPEPRRPLVTDHSLRLVGWALLIIAAPFTAIALKEALSLVMTGGYMALYQQDAETGAAAGPALIAHFLVPASLLLLAGSRRRRSLSAIASAGTLFVYSGTQLFLGKRYEALMPVFAYAWLWHRHLRPIPRWVLFGAVGGLVFVIFPLVAITRNTSGDQRLSLDAILEALDDVEKIYVLIIHEVGSTMNDTAHTIALVPSMRNYDLGLGYAYALLTALPNLFWHIHPTVERGLAGDWLVWTVDPTFARMGGGMGYSFIAESYLNFGWLGIPAMCGFFGWLWSTLVCRLDKPQSPDKLALLASLATSFTFFARSETGCVLRPMLWYALIPYLLVQVVARSERHQSINAAVSS
jgi:oligosaccharide repeat unit polymerase